MSTGSHDCTSSRPVAGRCTVAPMKFSKRQILAKHPVHPTTGSFPELRVVKTQGSVQERFAKHKQCSRGHTSQGNRSRSLCINEQQERKPVGGDTVRQRYCACF